MINKKIVRDQIHFNLPVAVNILRSGIPLAPAVERPGNFQKNGGKIGQNSL
ncbi:MAG TPA: hypothetical protein VI588_02250 [Candidatus Gracilibacteria bacterium]|nr:hypothetical protein [Candidatus Gracilibacteria bacterium]